MGAFGLMGGEYEQVVYNHDPASGLKAIIAIHSTALGPALGGTRFYPYASEDDALADVLRLAKGMSYKAAVAGLNLGGGKAVIIGDPKRIKSEALLRAYGRFVESLGGRYITAEDIGTYIPDMDVVALETRFVTGRSPANGGGGDPSINTAYGVLKGMQAVAEELWNEHDLAGRHVVVQGVGKVGDTSATCCTRPGRGSPWPTWTSTTWPGRSGSSAPTPWSRARPTRSSATSSPPAPWGRSSTTTPCPS